ncbi:MAG TPA: YggS family pyridoxal phosphate-dependent enzyme [Bdellovibrio sp.]|nr:YggS family pyridoxal phosphate-dependent enzyme [Bdellovibrio sp.]
MQTLTTLQSQISPAKILAVSKLQPQEKIRALYNESQRLFGENYVQEALTKLQQLEDLKDIEWHFIGHLQKNKAKQVVGRFHLIHSVDSLELAKMLSHQCETQGVTQNILLQVNLAGEESKSGFSKEIVISQWSEITRLPHLHIFGLMTMPPLTETGEQVRHYFRELRELRDELQKHVDAAVHPLTELSMGTSHDYQVAVEEGATILRLGTILFGERPSKR